VWYESLSFKITVLEVLLGYSRHYGHWGALLGCPYWTHLELLTILNSNRITHNYTLSPNGVKCDFPDKATII
jgi:hypothetical protein